jgi:hypothetical protein
MPIATSLCGIGDVGKSFCEIDQSLREPIDVSHLKPLLSSILRVTLVGRGGSLPRMVQTLIAEAPPPF